MKIDFNNKTPDDNYSTNIKQPKVQKEEDNCLFNLNKSNNSNITSTNEELGIDGKIDDYVIQSQDTDDCWLLSGVNALNTTEKGKQIIRNSIIPNDDGTVTVKFAGAGKSYTITAEEIEEFDTDDNEYDEYSNGDNDMLVLELAMEKLREENPEACKLGPNILDFGHYREIWNALVENPSIHEYDEADKNIDEILDEAYNNKNIGVGFALGDKGQEHSAFLSDGRLFEFSFSGHALSVIKITENEVIFNDPYDEEQYTMTREEFKNLNPSGIYTIDLTNK